MPIAVDDRATMPLEVGSEAVGIELVDMLHAVIAVAISANGAAQMRVLMESIPFSRKRCESHRESGDTRPDCKNDPMPKRAPAPACARSARLSARDHNRPWDGPAAGPL